MRRVRMFCAVLIAAALLMTAVAIPDASSRNDEVPESFSLNDISYAEGRSFDLHIPLGRSGPHPVMIILHGGGFVDGERDEMDGLAEMAARNGILAFNMSYRLAPEHQYPTQMVDIGLVVQWARTYGVIFGANPNQIVLAGHSAGGTLALAAGLHPDIDVDGIIPISAASDLELLAATDPQSAVVTEALAGELPRAFISPISHVSPDDPPVFIIHGDSDPAVHPVHAIILQQQLEANGVPNEVFFYPGGHRILFNPETSFDIIGAVISATWVFALT